MVTVKRFDVLSVGMMLGCTYAILGLIIGGFMSLIALLGAANAPAGGGAGMLVGVGAILFVPLFYGVIGFIGGIISSLIYNVLAGMIGGIKIEITDDRRRSLRDEEDDDR